MVVISRFTAYSLVSFLLTGALIASAANKYQQYYPTAVHLMTSKISRVTFANDAIILLVLFGKLVKRIFFGQLRDPEVEKIHERIYITIIETCLAMNIFREEITSSVFATFVVILFIKIFHWITRMRVEFIEQTPTTRVSIFARLYILLSVLILVDGYFAITLYKRLAVEGPSVLLLFITEYLILLCDSISTAVRLTFHAMNYYMERGWENKGIYTFYLEIANDLIQCLIYISFFVVIFYFYGVPIHLIRDLFYKIKSFQKRIMDFLRYRRIVANLDERFSDATPEQLSQGDNVCVVCFEEMTTAKRLPCGHMFHAHCLRSWLAQSQICPTCRESVDVPQHHAEEQQQQQPAAVPGVPPAEAAVQQQQQQLQQLMNLLMQQQQQQVPAAVQVPGAQIAQPVQLPAQAVPAVQTVQVPAAAVPAPAAVPVAPAQQQPQAAQAVNMHQQQQQDYATMMMSMMAMPNPYIMLGQYLFPPPIPPMPTPTAGTTSVNPAANDIAVAMVREYTTYIRMLNVLTSDYLQHMDALMARATTTSDASNSTTGNATTVPTAPADNSVPEASSSTTISSGSNNDNNNNNSAQSEASPFVQQQQQQQRAEQEIDKAAELRKLRLARFASMQQGSGSSGASSSSVDSSSTTRRRPSSSNPEGEEN